MGRLLVLGLSALLLGCAAAGETASLYPSCAARDDVADRLKRGYAESPVAMGLSTEGAVVEVYASNAGSFTIVLTSPRGVSCVVVTGESWEGFRGFTSGSGI